MAGKRIFMKQAAIFFLTVSIGVLLSCSGKVDPKTPLLVSAVNMAQETDPAKIASFYTDGTVSAAEAFGRKTNGTDILGGLDRKLFLKGSKWDLKSEKKDGNTAEVVIVITAHPARNMIGYEATIPLRFEHGTWKIDREKYIRAMVLTM